MAKQSDTPPTHEDLLKQIEEATAKRAEAQEAVEKARENHAKADLKLNDANVAVQRADAEIEEAVQALKLSSTRKESEDA